MALYLYGVGHRTLAPPAGVDGVAPSTGARVVADGDLGALVADLRSDGPDGRPPATTANLAAHERVVDAAADCGPFVPARFGVVADNDDSLVNRLLRARHAALIRTLAHLSGRAELRVTVTFEGDHLLREAVARNPLLARLRRRVQGRPATATYYDRIALGEAAREAVLRIQHRELDALHARLLRVVAELKPLAPPDGTTARLAVLVGTDDLDRLDEELEAYAADLDGLVRFDLLGPIAPWDFAELGAGPEDAGGSPVRRQRMPQRLGAY